MHLICKACVICICVKWYLALGSVLAELMELEASTRKCLACYSDFNAASFTLQPQDDASNERCHIRRSMIRVTLQESLCPSRFAQ